jgi:hypothetical protein
VKLHVGEAEGEGHQLRTQADQGGLEDVDHGHHPGLLQESVQLQAQEDPAGVRCHGRGHHVLIICLNICKNM